MKNFYRNRNSRHAFQTAQVKKWPWIFVLQRQNMRTPNISQHRPLDNLFELFLFAAIYICYFRAGRWLTSKLWPSRSLPKFQKTYSNPISLIIYSKYIKMDIPNKHTNFIYFNILYYIKLIWYIILIILIIFEI